MLEPSPLLKLARSERELHTPMRAHGPGPVQHESSDRSEELDTTLDDDGIRRNVRVPRFRLATEEDLVRYALRFAENRRPREFFQTRYLIRARRVHGLSRATKRRARRAVDEVDPQIAMCLTQAVAARPSVVLRTPAALVLEQALKSAPVDYSIIISFDADANVEVETIPAVHEAAQECLDHVFASGTRPRARRARVELTAFVQPTSGGFNMHLANEAATLGWVEFERRAYVEALEYFEDAYWLYHRAEYLLLQGMAMQKLGNISAALSRYRTFVDERPIAPENEMIRARIVELERSLPVPSDVRGDGGE